MIRSLVAVENYFNYFTEIEECFRQRRGTPTLLSSLDWALVESWKEAGIPLQAVLIGIDRSFQKFAKRRQRFKKVNSLAYCSQAVLQAAEELNAAVGEGGRGSGSQGAAKAPFTTGEIEHFLRRNAEALEQAARSERETGQRVLAEDLSEAATTIRRTAAAAAQMVSDLENLESYLSALEDKLTASLTRASSAELLAQFHQEVHRGLIPYRQKMTAAQIESLERQFVKKRLLEHYRVPRLSLFYL